MHADPCANRVKLFSILRGQSAGVVSFEKQVSLHVRTTLVRVPRATHPRISLSLSPSLCQYQTANLHTQISYGVKLKAKVKWSRYRPGVAQRVGTGITLLFHDRGTRRGWVVGSTLRPHLPQERPGTDCTGGWVGPRAGMDGRKISSPPGFDPGSSSS